MCLLYIFDVRLQSIGPMIKRKSFQKDYEKNKAFHDRRKKFVPFGVASVAPTSSSRRQSQANMQSSSESYHDKNDEFEDVDPESDSFLSQYRSMHNIGGNYGNDELGASNSFKNPDMPQSISEFRRQVISKKKLQNSGSIMNTKKLTPLNTDIDTDYNDTKSKFMLTHDPENN